MTPEVSQFHVNVRKYYALAAAWKASLFGAIGYVAASNNDVATGRLIFALVVVLVLTALTEYYWFYRPSMKKHFELLERFGDAYEHKLVEAIQQIGYGRIVSSFWISRCYDQMDRNPKD